MYKYIDYWQHWIQNTSFRTVKDNNDNHLSDDKI